MMKSCARESPNPGTARPQYVHSRKARRFSRAVRSRYSTNRGHLRQETISSCSTRSAADGFTGAPRPSGTVRVPLRGCLRAAILQRQTKARLASSGVLAVFQGQAAAVSLGDLAAQHKADAGAAGLGGEEGHKKVGSVRQSGAFVIHPDFQVAGVLLPAELHGSAGFQRSIGGIADQIDEELFDLVAVGRNRKQ